MHWASRYWSLLLARGQKVAKKLSDLAGRMFAMAGSEDKDDFFVVFCLQVFVLTVVTKGGGVTRLRLRVALCRERLQFSCSKFNWMDVVISGRNQY